MYQAFGDKLIAVTERYAEEIAKEWCKAVRTNPRTPSYHSMSQDECYPIALDFYANHLRPLYFSKKPYTEVQDYFERFAENSYKAGHPVHEAAYALMMMRRHIWFYADFQAYFTSSLEQYQAVESINRTINFFDHGTYYFIKKCAELIQK